MEKGINNQSKCWRDVKKNADYEMSLYFIRKWKIVTELFERVPLIEYGP
jgi:hypothetical protein